MSEWVLREGGLPGFCEDLQVGGQRELLFVGPLVPARAGVALAVEALPLLDAVVHVPGLADQRLPADLAHVLRGPEEVISGYAPEISIRDLQAATDQASGWSPIAATNFLKSESLIMNSGSCNRSRIFASGVPILLASSTIAL